MSQQVTIKKRTRGRVNGKKISKPELYKKILEKIQEGYLTPLTIGAQIGKSKKQTRRYIDEMADLGMVNLSADRMIEKTTAQAKRESYSKLEHDDFAQIPEIKKMIELGIAKGNKARTLYGYASNLKRIFNDTETHPSDVVGFGKTKEDAIEFSRQFFSAFKVENPTVGTHGYRIAYKVFLAAHGITFGHGEGKAYGLGSEHDKYGAYAGVHFTKEQTDAISKAILDAKDDEVYLWWRIGLRTGARSGAIASLVWEKIIFNFKDSAGNESFKLEVHETKDPKGHIHIGEDGEWKTKFPTLEVKQLLQKWRESHPEFARFVFFAERGSDVLNRQSIAKTHRVLARRLKTYYKSAAGVWDSLDQLTKDYCEIMPDHMMRHTFAQQCKNAGMTAEEIAEAGGWKTAGIVSTWYSKTSDAEKEKISSKAREIHF